MAAISNARDNSLQGTSPRLTVTAVTIVADGAAFLKDKNASTVTPASISLTTNIVGFTSPTYTWSYATSLAPTTFTTISGATTSSYSVTNANFLTHLGSGVSVIYKCKVTQTGWADAETTTTITYTKRANDVPVATLNKSSILLPTTADGVVDYLNSDSKITVSIGGTNIPYAASGANSFSVSAAVTVGTITIGTASTTTTTVTNDTRSFGILSAMGSGTTLATITYTVTARDVDNVATTITLTQTISKAISGASGYVYKLLVPSIVARRLDNINFTPTTITASATVNIGSAAATTYPGIFKIYTSTDNGSNYTLRDTSTAVSSYTYTIQDYLSTPTTNIKVELYLNDGTTLLDSEVIPVNREGQYALNLTNDNHTVSTPASGQASNLNITSEAEIYFGLTKQTTGWTFNWVASAGITIINGTTSTVTVTDVTADGTVTVTATQTSTSLTRTAVFTISRAIAGNDAINIDLLSESDVTSALADGTGYILPLNNQIKLYKAGALITTGVVYGPGTATTQNGLTATVNTSTGVVTFSGSTGWTSNQETFTFTATYNSVVYSATYTYSKSKQGADSVLIDLISEAGVVTAAADGTVTGTLPTGNAIKLYKGGVLVTPTSYGGTATKNGLTLTVDASGNITLSESGWSTNEENFNVTAVYNGVTYTANYSIAKSKTGIAGATGTAYWLVTSASAIQKSTANIYNPTTLTVSGYSAVGTSSPALYAGRFKIYENGSGTASYVSNANESSKIYTPSGTGVTSIKVEFYLASVDVASITTKLDEQTVPMVIDGTNAITGVLSNESANVPATSGGVVTSWTGASTVLTIYNGSTDDSANWTYSATKTNVTCTEAVTSRTQTVTAMSAPVGYVDITASRSGYSNITKRFTIVKTLAGADSTVAGPTGASRYIAYIASSSSTTVPGTPANTIDGTIPGSWSSTPVALTGTQAQFQSDGFRPAGATANTANTVWSTPYLSYFKVGSLNAVSASTGALSVTDAITVDTSGHIKGGQTTYNSGNGFFLGYNTSAYKFSVGNSGGSALTWDGSALSISGSSNIDISGNGRFRGTGGSGWSGLGTVGLIVNDTHTAEFGAIISGNQATKNSLYASQSGVAAAVVAINNSGIAQGIINSASLASATYGAYIDGGIKFPAAFVNNTDPNTLDDYEEGSFTSTLTNFGLNPTHSFTYVKIGKVVTFTLKVTAAGLNTSEPGGTLTSFTLPFPAANTTAFSVGVYLMSGPSGGYLQSKTTGTGSSSTVEVSYVSNGSGNSILRDYFQNGSMLIISGSYIT